MHTHMQYEYVKWITVQAVRHTVRIDIDILTLDLDQTETENIAVNYSLIPFTFSCSQSKHWGQHIGLLHCLEYKVNCSNIYCSKNIYLNCYCLKFLITSNLSLESRDIEICWPSVFIQSAEEAFTPLVVGGY